MGFDTNVRLLGLFTKTFLRNDESRQVSTREAAALLPFAGGKAMDCRHQFKSEVHRGYIGGTSGVGRRHLGSNLCLTLIFKPTLTLG